MTNINRIWWPNKIGQNKNKIFKTLKKYIYSLTQSLDLEIYPKGRITEIYAYFGIIYTGGKLEAVLTLNNRGLV